MRECTAVRRMGSAPTCGASEAQGKQSLQWLPYQLRLLGRVLDRRFLYPRPNLSEGRYPITCAVEGKRYPGRVLSIFWASFSSPRKWWQYGNFHSVLKCYVMVYIPLHSLYLFVTFLYMYLLFNPECAFSRGQFSYYLFIDWVTLPWHRTASCPNSRTQQVFSRKEFIVSTRQQTSREIYDGFLEPSFPSWTSILQKKAQRYVRDKEFNTGKTRGHLVLNSEEFILGNQGS